MTFGAHDGIKKMPTTASTPAQKKFERWSSRVNDPSEDVRRTSIEMLAEVARDDAALRARALSCLAVHLRDHPDDRKMTLWQVERELDGCAAMHPELMAAVISVANAPESEGFAMSLLWKLINDGRMGAAHASLAAARTVAQAYLQSMVEDERDAAFQIVDWCEDNLA